MDHFEKIYAHRAQEYHRMVTVEDVEQHLLPALGLDGPQDGLKILDLGSGTGRIPLLLHPQPVRLAALDLNRAMLAEQAVQRSALGGSWPLVEGDMRALPFVSRWADVVTAGWAIGHLRAWYAQDWQTHMTRILHEMLRVVRPGGRVIIMETLSTGSLIPQPPTPELAEYYAWLENRWGFTRQQISTDYQFPDVDTAVAWTEFFFGAELAESIRRNAWARLPEWTGVWTLQIPG